MTGCDLKELLGRLNMSYNDMAKLTGYTPQYIGMLVRDSETEIGDAALEKIRTALLQASKVAAEVFFELAGGPQS